MLRKIFSSGWDAAASSEVDIVEQLAALYGQLPTDGAMVDLRSEEAGQACAKFLSSLERAAQQMGLKPAPREYRNHFSPNYRSLFPDWDRHYRVDVLAASAEQHSAIYVNGDKFELSPEAIGHGEALQSSWHCLCEALTRWSLASAANSPVSCPTRGELANVLVQLDHSWASFENKYISELICIEEQARLLIVQAVSQEAELRSLETKEARNAKAARREARRDLVASIAHLNSVANFRGKGRDDLKVEILESANAILQREEVSAPSAARVLAADVVESFAAMRAYLQRVSNCLERVDPHLCNNAGLVAQLLDWEESWEVGARFVRDQKVFAAVSDLVSEMQAAQRVAPSLTAMITDCDVELFMALPRILWLCFLDARDGPRAELLRMLLPHRFQAREGRQAEPDAELQAFLASFGSAVDSLGGRDAAWPLLVKRAVSGASTNVAHEGVVEELMHELERWSIELQRHCPEDWNQCSAVLVQCLSGEQQKQRCVKFQV